MDILRWLDGRGGVAHRSEAVRAGFGRRAQAMARTLGRWWLASPGADPLLVRAAELNARIACVSAAARHGLAVLREPRLLHVSTSPNSDHPASPGLRIHRSRRLAPVPKHLLVESPPDMLAHVAECLPRVDALVVWESALRKRLLTQSTLRSIPWRRAAARALSTEASPLSDSLLETVLADGLRRRGIPFRQQVPIGGHRVDFLVCERVVAQTDGIEFHSRPEDRRRDIEHDARLLLDGVGVLRFDSHHVLERLEETLDRVLEMSWRSAS